MRRYYVDTNVFLRFLLQDISSQYNFARKYFVKAKNKEIELVSCQAVIFEIDYNLRKLYGFDKDKVVKALATIVDAPYLIIEDQKAFQETLLVYLHNNLDLVDCFLFSKAKLDQAEVLSFDKGFKKRPN